MQSKGIMRSEASIINNKTLHPSAWCCRLSVVVVGKLYSHKDEAHEENLPQTFLP